MATKTKITTQVIETIESTGLKMELVQHTLASVGFDVHGQEVGNALTSMESRLSYTVKCTIANSGVLLEPGALHYMYGSLQLSTVGGGMGGMLKRAAGGESASLTEVTGTGHVFLEPNKPSKHFVFLEMEDETLICDRGLFFAGANTLKVGSEMQGNISAALFGGEGLFQTKVSGSGLVVFEMPVYGDELQCVELRNEKLFVDGTFAVMRTGGIEFKVEKSAKSKSAIGSSLSSLKSGEGLLQTFSGTGKVWLAPTIDIRASF